MAGKAGAVRNLSQLQIANASYATDHNGKYVPYLVNDDKGNRAGFWYQVPEFLNYFRGESEDANGNPSKTVSLSMLDPKVIRAKADNFHKSMAGSFGQNITGMSGFAGTPNASPSRTMTTISAPEQSMAFATATDVRVVYNARFNCKGVEGKTSDGGIAYRHGNKALVVYYDGHVGEMSNEDMKLIDKSNGGSKSALWLPDR